MRLSRLVALGALCAGGYWLWNHREVARESVFRLVQSAAVPTATPERSEPAVPQPGVTDSEALPPIAPNRVRILCPACKGERQLMIARGHAKTDRPYGCPICVGAGSIERIVKPGYAICPDCQGMARRLYNSRQEIIVPPPSQSDLHDRLYATPCKRCYGTGLVRTADR